ncbi:TonB-dependent receptor [Sphingopyxis sp. 22461]|uniref:TonB-dependent receptor n=1 Tax=Sphingopyxis sp. 22461 TaxID=3453923 RepID=UPI003F829873
MPVVSILAIAAGISTPSFAQDASSPATGAATAQADTERPSQGGIEDIVVTAQRRSENVQDVPIAISAFTASGLEERAIQSVASLSGLAPNVTFDAGTPFSGSSSVLAAYVRGIGSNDFAFNIDPGVGVYLDGVYLARSVGANQELGDVERIEVLKGPQGTLFGRNTIGGAVSIVTHDPGDTFRFVGDATVGRYKFFQARGTADIPISDTLKSSVSFAVKTRDGYFKRQSFPGAQPGTYQVEPPSAYSAAGYENSGLGSEGGENSWSLRTKLKWEPLDNLRATLSGDYSNSRQEQLPNTLLATTPDIAGGAFDVFAGTYNCGIAGQSTGCGNGPPSFVYGQRRAGRTGLFDLPPIFGVNADGNPDNDRLPYDDRFITGDKDTSYATGSNFSHMRSYGAAGTIEFDLSDSVTLKSITAYRELHWKAGLDADGSPINMLQISFEMNQKQFSQELQLLGSALDDRLKYVMGAYYFSESGNLHEYVTFAEGLLSIDGDNILSTKNGAVFGQIDFKPNDLIGITLGARYTEEKKEFEGKQTDLNGLTYKILNGFGVPPCASLTPISDDCRLAAGFPNPGAPLQLYPGGVNRKKFNNFSPKIGVQLYPADDLMAYASWSKGYKTGGWTTRLSNPLPTAPSFDEEKATTWEIGFKSQLFDRRLQLNAAAFTTSYKGIQLNFQQGVSPVIQNAGDARIKGFEAEVVFAPVQSFTLNSSVGYVDAKYTSVLQGAVVAPNPVQAGVFTGAELPKTPHWKVNMSPRFEFDVGDTGIKVIALADWTYTSRMRNDTEGTFLLDRKASQVVNANITLRLPDDRYSVTVGGTNIFNERFLTTGQAQIAGGMLYGTYNRPAEWYARLGVKF